MTLEEFLKEFKEELMKDDGVIAKTRFSAVRILSKDSGGPLYCPLTYLCDRKLGKKFNPVDFKAAGFELGIKEAAIVAYSADSVTGHSLYNHGLNQELMLIARKKQEQVS